MTTELYMSVKVILNMLLEYRIIYSNLGMECCYSTWVIASFIPLVFIYLEYSLLMDLSRYTCFLSQIWECCSLTVRHTWVVLFSFTSLFELFASLFIYSTIAA